MSRKVKSIEIEVVERKGEQVNVIVLTNGAPTPTELSEDSNHVIIRIKG
ncbi:hypothetical protein U2I53_13240 [Lysinibacillus capsici]|nr:hypothetical protein [Lysinibacillus sp. OF-1]WCH48142.1 hypothetical protein NV349_01790 [Lysinibacillus sp. OF-1]